MRGTAEQRFWAKVDVRGPDDCWPWLGCRDRDGYPKIKVDGTYRRATHVALMIDGRPRIGNLQALHSCDNPPCCNAKHLRWGTTVENMADKTARGRQARGATHGSVTKPDSRQRGLDHWAFYKPESLARGQRHGSVTKPDRVPRGMSAGRSKLTDDSVRYIRSSEKSLTALASELGVSIAAVGYVRRGKTWAHVQ